MNWWMQLNKTRGSRPRCVQLMHGPRGLVASRLTELIGLPDVVVGDKDKWMPAGIPVQRPDGTWDRSPADELVMNKPNKLVPPDVQKKIVSWWLAHESGANMPNWDMASTCTIRGKSGLLLVEAKAHDHELRGEEKGKSLYASASEASYANHLQIGRAIADAAAQFQRDTRLPWAISRDTRYQMSNRFATACKLAELGKPVVLVYLGFLNADEMADQGKPFKKPEEWASLVKSHSAVLFPDKVWGQEWNIHGQAFVPLIRSYELPLEESPS